MKRDAKAGILPLYLKLYDERLPEMRNELEAFLRTIQSGLESKGLDVTVAPICRVQDEFQLAIQSLEAAGVDVIVTLHLAYSPSLESAELLAKTSLPVLILDTTIDESFGTDVHPERILYNHGIHGVQDLASMLRRYGKPYQIAAGHFQKSDVLDRAANRVRAAYGAAELRRTKALRIGEAFKGMGDFSVSEKVLYSTLGIRTEQIAAADLAEEIRTIQESEIEEEISFNKSAFKYMVPDEVQRRSLYVGLALRKRLDQGGYGAFSMNFAAFDTDQPPINTVPFLEASKAMARGIGYAGEGDVLTASLVGALSRAFGKTTFTEIFCPDWKGNSLFLSHMGEINPDVSKKKPLLFEKPFPFTDALNPAVIACSPAPGPAVLVNLTPGPGDTYTLLIAPVEVLEDTTRPDLQETVRGWIRPRRSLGEFLEIYSIHGGTHHSALVLGERAEAIASFAAFAGIPHVII